MAQVLAEVRLAGSPLQSYRHVCAFFRSPDEFYTVLLPFIKEGFDRRERALHIVDPKLRAEHIRRLEGIGIDTAAAEASQQLELRVWEEAYLRGGHFVPDAMLTLLEERLSAGQTEGFPLTRLVATVEWALQDRPGVDDLVEYEARVNYLAASHARSEEHTSELQSRGHLVCRLLLEKKKKNTKHREDDKHTGMKM